MTVLTRRFRSTEFDPDEHHFAENGFYKLFWIFTFGSLFGFFIETLWGFYKHGELLVRSSMVLGPFNFIYGAGALGFYLIVRHTRRQGPLHILFAGMLAGTVIEHACSLFQELVFGTVSWDYSGMPLNIGGRVCLLYTFFWGILALVWAKLLQPPVERLIVKIPNRFGRQLSWVVLAFFIVFSVISIAAVCRWSGRIDGVPPSGEVGAFLDRHFGDRYMEIIYNNMVFVTK